MLKLNNTFLNENKNFYKILDVCEDYYLVVRTQDNPESNTIQFIIVTGLEDTGKTVEREIKLYSWLRGHYFDNITEAVKCWNALKKYY
jgi:hypothetical protein